MRQINLRHLFKIFILIMAILFLSACQKHSVNKTFTNPHDKSLSSIINILNYVFSVHNFDLMDKNQEADTATLDYQKAKQDSLEPSPSFNSLIPDHFKPGQHILVKLSKGPESVDMVFEYNSDGLGGAQPKEMDSMMTSIQKVINQADSGFSPNSIAY